VPIAARDTSVAGWVVAKRFDVIEENRIAGTAGAMNVCREGER
jgi:hypothetical protein